MKNQPVALTHNEQSASVFEFLVRVYWEDTDAGGIVFYANYLKFFERARTEWLRSLGLHQQALKDELGGMFVVTQANLRYHRPARLDDLLYVTACLASAGRSQCSLHQQAWLLPTHGTGGIGTPGIGTGHSGTGDSGPLAAGAHTPAGTSKAALPSVTDSAHLLCEGQVHIAWVDALRLKPQRMPANLLAALQGAPAVPTQPATPL